MFMLCTIVWSSAASGSGTVDFDAVEAIRFGKSYPVTYSAGYMTADAGNWTIASSSDWDVKNNSYKWGMCND